MKELQRLMNVVT